MIGSNDRDIEYYKDIPEANSELFKRFRTYRFFRTLWMHILNKMNKRGIYKPEADKINDDSESKYPFQRTRHDDKIRINSAQDQDIAEGFVDQGTKRSVAEYVD